MAKDDQNTEATEDEEAPKQAGVISVESNKSKRSVSFKKTFGANLDEATKLYSADVVFKIFHQKAVIACQACVRGKLDKLKENGDPTFTEAEAIAAGQAYVPNAPRAAGKTKTVDKAAELAQLVRDGKMSKEDMALQIMEMHGL